MYITVYIIKMKTLNCLAI